MRRRFTIALALLWLTAWPAAAQHGQAPPPGDEKKPPSQGSKIIQQFHYPPIHWSVPQVGREIFDLMLRVASGQKTCAERLGHKEFVPWRIGPMM